jgi:hypothetical protein
MAVGKDRLKDELENADRKRPQIKNSGGQVDRWCTRHPRPPNLGHLEDVFDEVD